MDTGLRASLGVTNHFGELLQEHLAEAWASPVTHLWVVSYCYSLACEKGRPHPHLRGLSKETGRQGLGQPLPPSTQWGRRAPQTGHGNWADSP